MTTAREEALNILDIYDDSFDGEDPAVLTGNVEPHGFATDEDVSFVVTFESGTQIRVRVTEIPQP